MKWKESTKIWQNFQFTIVDNDKKTIAIFTFATGDKCYSTLWWDGFYGKLQSAFGRQYNIMEVLPVENVSQINFKAPHYYIREIMTNTEVFTGADSGMMHLASASIEPDGCLVFRYRSERYCPYNSRSIAINTNIPYLRTK